MDFNEMIDMVECVACHRCPLKAGELNRCATCEVGYQFISENPLQLNCGHVICAKCKQGENIECSKDGFKNIRNESPVVERLISKKKNDLMQNLRDKLNVSYGIFEGILKFIII